MPIKSKYLFVVSMDVDPDKEALFNEVYDGEHVPNLLQVPGVHTAARMAGEPFVLNIGGEDKRIAQDGPRYTALYEIDGPHVLVSREWAQASEKGAGLARCAPTPATGGTRSTSCASRACVVQALTLAAVRRGRARRADRAESPDSSRSSGSGPCPS